MDLGIRGKRALVCGASSGLGEATALALAHEGVEVTINSRSEERLSLTAQKIRQATHYQPAIIAADISKGADIERLVSEVGDVDILIVNGGGPPPGDFLELPAEKWLEAADLLLHAAINLTRGFLESMKDRKWGRLIYITSIAAIQPVDTLILSNTYRAGITGFCKTISNNYAKYGITANCVCPGYTGTERLNELAENLAKTSGQTPHQVMNSFAQSTPVGRVGKPEELGATIAFLASSHAAFITGSSIAVDGGARRALF